MSHIFSIAAPPIFLTSTPLEDTITVTDVPPYNEYSLSCRASLPSDLQSLTLNITWHDFTSNTDLSPSNVISINSGAFMAGNVTVFNSVLSVREVRNGSQILVRGCSVNVIQALPLGGGDLVLPRVRNATETIIIRGN